MKNSPVSLTIALLFLFVSSDVISQIQDKYGREIKKVQYQVRGAFNSSSISVESKNSHVYGSEKSKTGYNFGLVADIAIGKSFYFQPGLSLTSKGSKVRGMDYEEWGGEANLNAVYLQVPLLFAYKIFLKKWNNSFNIGVGPYIAYGIGGNVSGKNTAKSNTFGDYGWCNRPDIGYSMELSFEMPRIILFMGGEYGFTHMLKNSILLPEYQNDISFHNSNSYIGIGYKF